MLRSSLLAVAIALTSALAVPTAARADRGPGGGGSSTETRVEGTVTAVAGSTMTIRTAGGKTMDVTAVAATKVERNGRAAAVSQFKVGDKAQARLTNGTATKIEATGV